MSLSSKQVMEGQRHSAEMWKMCTALAEEVPIDLLLSLATACLSASYSEDGSKYRLLFDGLPSTAQRMVLAMASAALAESMARITPKAPGRTTDD